MKDKIKDKQKIKELTEAFKNSQSNLENQIGKREILEVDNIKLRGQVLGLRRSCEESEEKNETLKNNFEGILNSKEYAEGYIRGLKEEIKLLTMLITGGGWKDINAENLNEINPIRNFPDCSRYNNN